MSRARSLIVSILAALALVTLAVVGFTPIHSASRDEIFAIPKGTWARRMAGDQVEILADHTSGQMTIVVEPNPTTPWARIRWRLGELLRR
jgi:hypothetical protein